jgi:coenzyme F420-reducing hydrogenase delta subunit
VEVCPFDAVQVIGANGVAPHAQIEPALCRGCNLCTAVCSTDAALPVRPPLAGWDGATDLVAGKEKTHVVLTCEKRAASLEALPQPEGVRLAFIRLRCVGEVESGMLVDLVRRGAGQVLVGGCGTERCHYGKGAGLAREQVQAARAMLRLLGFEEARIAEDWSLDRTQDSLDETIARLGTAPDAPRPVAS